MVYENFTTLQSDIMQKNSTIIVTAYFHKFIKKSDGKVVNTYPVDKSHITSDINVFKKEVEVLFDYK